MTDEPAFDGVYIDASAALKLLLAEPESEALQAFLEPVATSASSEILVAELIRAVRRRVSADDLAHESLLRTTATLIEGMHLVTLDRDVVRLAGLLDPVTLGTLDALHVASAIRLGAVSTFVSYDRRQLEAARRTGLATVSPGAEG